MLVGDSDSATRLDATNATMPSFKPSTAFYDAASYMTSGSGPSGLSNNTKLELYGLYKFLTEGVEPATSRPSLFDITGRAKWDSWKSTGNKHAGKEAEAQERYVSIAASCGWVQGETVNEACVQALEEEPSAEELLSRETPERNSDEAGIGAVVSTVSMEDEGIDDEETLHGLAIVGDPTKMKQFLKDNSDANLNVVDEYGYTPVHLASDRGHAKVVDILLEHGANISLKDQDGLTAEELAAEAGHKDIVSALKKHKLASTAP